MIRTPAVAVLPSVAGGPGSDFNGVFWPLRAAARNASGRQRLADRLGSDLPEDRLQGLNSRSERISIGVYGVGQ
jgi:hypothetical protein